MRGNIAPDTGVAKPAAIAPEARQFTGRAVCFDGEHDCVEAIKARKIEPGMVIVVRYEGPKGGPGMREMYLPMKLLNGQGLGQDHGPHNGPGAFPARTTAASWATSRQRPLPADP